MRALAALVVLLSGVGLAGTKVLQNDTFTGSGPVYAGVDFGEYQGAGVIFEPAPSDYPLTIIGVDILCVGFNQQGSGFGAYVIDVYDEAGTHPAPRPNDAGVWDDFIMSAGYLDQAGLQLTTSNATFNRFTLPNPVVVQSGRVFVQVSEQNSTSGQGGSLGDGTTIAMDTSSVMRSGANWFFDGYGTFHPLAQPDGGFYGGLNRNWIIRLVLRVPDQVVTVTSVTPNSGPATAPTDVIIEGTNFEVGAQAFVGSTELAVRSITGVSIGATVPAGVAPGQYAVRVHNPSGTEGTLPNGFTVLAADGGAGTGGGGGSTGTGGGGGSSGTEALALTAVTPTQTYASDATSLFLTGAGFKSGAQVLIGSTRIEGAVVESSGVISAALPAGLLSPGTYDVSVINLSGETATKPQSLKVLAGSAATARGCGCASVDLVPLGVLALLGGLRTRRRR